MTPPATFKLSPEEVIIITMMRRNTFQEIMVQIQDSVITSVNQILKYRRKKGGGLVAGHVTKPVAMNMAILTPEEIEVIKMVRDKPFQQVTIQIKNSLIEALNQTVKFRKKGGFSSLIE